MYAALRRPLGILVRLLLVTVLFLFVTEIAIYCNVKTLQGGFIGAFGGLKKESVLVTRQSYGWKPTVKETRAPVGFIAPNDQKVDIKIGKEENHTPKAETSNDGHRNAHAEKKFPDLEKDVKKNISDHEVDTETRKEESHKENQNKEEDDKHDHDIGDDKHDHDQDDYKPHHDLETEKAKRLKENQNGEEDEKRNNDKDDTIPDHDKGDDKHNHDKSDGHDHNKGDDKHDHDKDDKHGHDKGDDKHNHKGDDQNDHDKGDKEHDDKGDDNHDHDHDKDDKHEHDEGDEKHDHDKDEKHDHNKGDDKHNHDKGDDQNDHDKGDEKHDDKGDDNHDHDKHEHDKGDEKHDKGDDNHDHDKDDKHNHDKGDEEHHDKGDDNHDHDKDDDIHHKGEQNDKFDEELHENIEKMVESTNHRHGRKGDYVEHIYKTISYKGNHSDAKIKESAKSLVQLALHKAKHKLTTSESKMEVLGHFAKKVAIDRTLFVSVVDSSFAEMAINLLETSYLKFNITNFLFVCIDQRAKYLLPKTAGECYVYSDKIGTALYSKYHTPEFNQKTKIKTDVSLDLMLLGYTVIITDLDIVFFKNPLPYLKCDECDLMIQDNYNGILNSGFYLIKPTNASIALQQLSVSNSSKTSDDQDVLNFYAQLLYYSNILKVKVLDLALFQPGRVYFDNGNRFFHTDAECNECVLVHNNFVKGYVKKVYRMKELLLWRVDVDSHLGYYSCPKRMYLTYANPTATTINQQTEALQAAFNLGKLLDRTVILPQFNLGKMKCHFTAAFTSKIWKKYDWKLYRENSFLHHPKVPIKTKTKVSPLIVVSFGEKEQNTFNKNNIQLVLTQADKPNFVKRLAEIIINDPDISDYKVLNFTSLVFD